MKNSANTKHLLEDEGYFGPKSITWKMAADPVMIIAASGAAILQMLHPDVMRIIEMTGKFYKSPAKRAEGTGLYFQSIYYGDTKIADAAAKALRNLHDSLQVKHPVIGQFYTASEPSLLLWVHNTIVWIILESFKHYGPNLTLEEENQYIQEQYIAAKLVGLRPEMLPKNRQELDNYINEMDDQLALSKQSLHFRHFFLSAKRFPASVSGFVERLFIRAGVNLMLPLHCELYGINAPGIRKAMTKIIALVFIKLMRVFYPVKKAIPKIRKDLAIHSFGDEFLK